MTFRTAALVAASVAIALSSSPASAVVKVAPPASSGSSTTAARAGGGSSSAGAALTAGFIGAILVTIVWHELNGPACASRTKYNAANGYDDPRFWRPLCKRERAVKPIRVRG